MRSAGQLTYIFGVGIKELTLIRAAVRASGLDGERLQAAVGRAKAAGEINPLDVGQALRSLASTGSAQEAVFQRELGDDEKIALLSAADRVETLATADDFVAPAPPAAKPVVVKSPPVREVPSSELKPLAAVQAPARPTQAPAAAPTVEVVTDIGEQHQTEPGMIPRRKLPALLSLLKQAPVDAAQLAAQHAKDGLAEVPTGLLADTALDVFARTKWGQRLGQPTGLAFVTNRARARELLKSADLERVTPVTETLIGPSLISIDGERHHQLRQGMLPMFVDEQIEAMGPAIADTSRRLVEQLESAAARGARPDLFPTVRQHALDAVTRACFGVELSAAQRQTFFSAVDGVFFNALTHSALPSWVPSKGVRAFEQGHDALQALAAELLADARRPEHRGQRGMLSKLLEVELELEGGGRRKLTEEELRAQVLVIAIGAEAISSALAFTLFDLARDPARQAALRAELRAGFDPTNPSPRAAQDIAAVKDVWSQSLQEHPSVAVSLRQAKKDVTLGGCPFRKGTMFVMAPSVVHQDPTEEPGRTANEVGYTFGAFRHKCIGLPLAEAIIDRTLADVFSRVELSVPGAGEALHARKDGFVVHPDEVTPLTVRRLS